MPCARPPTSPAADADMVAEHRHPPWWIRRLAKGQYPDDWRAILAAGNTHPPMALRVNPLRTPPTTPWPSLPPPTPACDARQRRPAPRTPGAGAASGLCRRLPQRAGRRRPVRRQHLDSPTASACSTPAPRPAARPPHPRTAPTWRSPPSTPTPSAPLRSAKPRPPRPRRRGEDPRLPHLDRLVGRRPFDRILPTCPAASGVVRRNPTSSGCAVSTSPLRRPAGRDPRRPVADPRARVAKCSMPPARCLPKKRGSDRRLCEPPSPIAAACPSRTARLPVPACTEHDGFFYALLEKAA